MKKIALFVAALSILSTTAVSCGSSSSKDSSNESTEAEATAEETPVELKGIALADSVVDVTNDSQFRPGMKVDNVTVLDFNAVWCVPCKKLTPAFHQAAENFVGKVGFYSVDIDKNRATAEAFGVESVPTVVILTPDGKVNTLVGLNPFISAEQFKDADAEQTTKIILDNLSKIINESL